MGNIHSFFSGLYFRVKLFMLGVRFYEVLGGQESTPIYTATYFVDDVAVSFSFQRVTCTDLVLKRGELTTAVYNSYIVRIDFDEEEVNSSRSREILNNMKLLKNKAFFFNGHSNKFKATDEEKKFEVIVEIYIDFIKEIFRISKVE